MIGKIFSFGLLFFISLPAFGIITGELDKTIGTTDDVFMYTLIIEGEADGDVVFPDVDGLKIEQSGTSSSVSIVNGKITRRKELSYRIYPEKEGVYEIPAIQLVIDNQKAATLPIEFVVEKASYDSTRDVSSEVQVERLISESEIYQGQLVRILDRVYFKVQLVDASIERGSLDPSFRVVKSGEEKRYQKVINGENYSVIEYENWYVAGKSGEFDIDSFLLDVSYVDPNSPQRRRLSPFFDSFGGSGPVKKKRIHSQSGKLKVLPLASNGRRADFSGLVGNFKIQAKKSTESITTGESVSISLRIYGDGVTDTMARPKLESSLRVYEDKDEVLDRVENSNYVGERVFTYSILAGEAGDYELGKLRIQFFRPKLGIYEDLEVDLGSVLVSGASVLEKPRLEPDTLEQESEPAQLPSIVNSDINPFKTRSDFWSNISISLYVFSLLAFLFSLSSIGGSLFDWKFTKRILIRRKYRQIFSSIDTSHVDGLTVLEKELRSFLSESYGLNFYSLSHREILDQLSQRKLVVVSELESVFAVLDSVLYSKQSITPEQIRDLVSRVERLLLSV